MEAEGTKNMQHLKSIQDISSRYQGLILDIWGVIHNGKTLYPDVLPTLEQLKLEGKRIVLLSNAPRVAHIAKARLTEMGFPEALYDGIYTSGENCREALIRRHIPFYQNLGSAFFHVGPDRDRTIFEGLREYTQVQDPSSADFLLLTGTVEFEPTVDRYLPMLQEARARNIPAVCANADRYVVFGDDRMICSGLIAETYEKLGGQVYYHGKPNADMYPPVLDMLQTTAQESLAVGDGLMTDILGANQAGIDSLLIMDGVHREEFNQGLLQSSCEKVGAVPTYVLPKLC